MHRAIAVIAVLLGCFVFTQSAGAAPKPKMSFEQASKVAVQQALQKTARQSLEFPTKAAQSGGLGWNYACSQFGRNLADYWNLSRWFRNHGVQTYIAEANNIYENPPSLQRGANWWRCNSQSFASPEIPGLFYIRLRMEVAGSNAGGITGSTVACEVLYDFSQNIVGRDPPGCYLNV